MVHRVNRKIVFKSKKSPPQGRGEGNTSNFKIVRIHPGPTTPTVLVTTQTVRFDLTPLPIVSPFRVAAHEGGWNGRIFHFQEVKSPSPQHRFVIALHSPDGVFETGLCNGLFRKNGPRVGSGARVAHFLQSGLSTRLAKLCPFRAILRELQPGFSAFQTAWRRGRDSNPRYRC